MCTIRGPNQRILVCLQPTGGAAECRQPGGSCFSNFVSLSLSLASLPFLWCSSARSTVVGSTPPGSADILRSLIIICRFIIISLASMNEFNNNNNNNAEVGEILRQPASQPAGRASKADDSSQLNFPVVASVNPNKTNHLWEPRPGGGFTRRKSSPLLLAPLLERLANCSQPFGSTLLLDRPIISHARCTPVRQAKVALLSVKIS